MQPTSDHVGARTFVMMIASSFAVVGESLMKASQTGNAIVGLTVAPNS